jgi:hypothetical protein
VRLCMCVGTSGVGRNMYLLGSQGSGMFNHQDLLRTSSYVRTAGAPAHRAFTRRWQAVLLGEKFFVLCPPSHARDMGNHAPDAMYNQSIPANCFRDVLRAGDTLYYPADWYHQTLNAADVVTVAVTGTVLSAGNIVKAVTKMGFLCQNLDGVGKRVLMSRPVCDALEQCFEWMLKFHLAGPDSAPGAACAEG